jgi:hypothetical protein
MKVDYQSKKSAKSLQNVKNSLQKVCKKSAKRQKKSAKSALTADFADSRRLLKKSARFCPPMCVAIELLEEIKHVRFIVDVE